MKHHILESLKFESNINEFRLEISEEKLNSLLIKSDIRGEEICESTATGFCDWVFRLEHSTLNWVGKEKVSNLSVMRKEISNVVARNISGEIGEWEIVSCDTNSKEDKVYLSSALLINQQPLKMKPDLVLKNNKTGTVLIVEYKIPSTNVQKPNCGWPNLACQLWCYSWADEWRDQENVFLVGALFNWSFASQTVSLSEVIPRTTKSDLNMNFACASLFAKGGGTINLDLVKSKKIKSVFEKSQLTSRSSIATSWLDSF